ncbi:MAG: NAD(P)-dependent alcohol dehydrogenase [Cyclobacteriaceae bacterium]|nr:NAD(P)-dependent alcohol dehydrogenase [Cyclobacteriaceae bacterium]
MKALQLIESGKLSIVEIDQPKLQNGQVLVKLKAAALNRRDLWIREGKYPNIHPNITLGSDGCGVVVEVNDKINDQWLGKDVVINPNINWGDNPTVQSSEYSVLGMPVNGTFAEYIVVDVNRLVEQPAHLNDVQSAALPLGGLTAYRAIIKRGQLSPKSVVLISGFGGGVAQFAFQFAIALGAKVYVTSGSKSKVQKAIEKGAINGFNYTNNNWAKEAKKISGGFDIVIDSAGGDAINTFIKIMRPGGRIIFYGATNGLPSEIDMYRMFWNQITLQGSTMGNDNEFLEMIDFVSQHQLVPTVDSVRPFIEIIDAFDKIKAGNHVGKLVIDFN